MPFCENCGSELIAGASFCSNCGTKVGNSVHTAPLTSETSDASEIPETQEIFDAPKAPDAPNVPFVYDNTPVTQISSENDTPNADAEFDKSDIDSNKFMAVLAYLGLLVLIPIFAAKDSAYAKFHSNQGVVLLIAELVVTILGKVSVISFIAGLAKVVLFVFSIMGIVNAANGKAKELPIIGKFTVLK